MKKTLLTLAILLSGTAFFNHISALENYSPAAIEIPDNIEQIFNKSCYTCHNTNSKNKKGKQKLDFDKLNYFKSYQVISKLDKIADVVIENEMPPKKFHKKYPEKVLTRKDKEVLIDWIRQMTDQPKVNLESQMNDLVNQIVNSLGQNQKSKIAVMEFVDMQGHVTNLGRYLSEELTTRLYLTGKFEVIERQLLDKIVKEQQISLTGMVDESSAVELGKILGVDAIASGTVSDLGSSVKVNARLISAESGKLFSVASVEILKDNKIKVLLSQSITTTATTAATSGTNIQASASKTVKKEGYIFELQEAHLEGQTAICRLKITNTTSEVKVFYLSKAGRKNSAEILTMIYDNRGNETVVNAVKRGTNTTLMYEYPNLFKKTILGGTSIIIELQFEDVSSDVNKIALLQIIFELHPGKVIEFRNIPLKNN